MSACKSLHFYSTFNVIITSSLVFYTSQSVTHAHQQTPPVNDFARSTASVDDNKSEVGDVSCEFAGRRYGMGEQWRPKLEAQGIAYCVTCICKQNGKVECNSERCPVVPCANPVYEEDACCRTCPVNSQKLHSVEDFKQRPAKRNDEVPCLHQDEKYKDGERFTSDKTALIPNSDQCVLCVCSSGHVLCHLKKCPHLTCSTSIIMPGDCCPVCEDDKIMKDVEDLKPTVSISPQISSQLYGKKDTDKVIYESLHCKTGYRVYRDGDSWHPVIGPFGEMECVVCSCFAGKVECGRVQCPSTEELSCSNPQLIPGQCCLSCPKINNTTVPAEVTHHRHHHGSTRQTTDNDDGDIVDDNPDNSDEDVGTTSLSSVSHAKRSGEPLALNRHNTFCLRRRHMAVLYRSIEGRIGAHPDVTRSNETDSSDDNSKRDVQVIAAFVKEIGEPVIMHTWTIQNDQARYLHIQELAWHEFTLFEERKVHLDFIGIAKQKRVARFTRKEKSLVERCLNRCWEQVLHLITFLKLSVPVDIHDMRQENKQDDVVEENEMEMRQDKSGVSCPSGWSDAHLITFSP